MNAKPSDVDEYLAAVPEEARATLAELRRSIKAVAPDAAESISYGIPTYKYKGRPLASFGAAKKHCALYGLNSEAHPDELAAYDTSKGTIRFPPGEPLPRSLVTMLIDERVAEIDAASAARKGKRPDPPASV